MLYKFTKTKHPLESGNMVTLKIVLSATSVQIAKQRCRKKLADMGLPDLTDSMKMKVYGTV